MVMLRRRNAHGPPAAARAAHCRMDGPLPHGRPV